MPIPRSLFQTWKTHTVPAHLAPFQQTWKRFHPRWEFLLFDDRDNDKFARAFFPQYYEAYRSLPHAIQRVDMIRYMWLYQHGGVYADLDMQCLQSLEPLLQRHESHDIAILGEENQRHKDGSNRVGNAIMMSSPHHSFWLAVLDEIVRRAPRQQGRDVRETWTTTGPHMLHEVYQAVRHRDERIEVMPALVFYPRAWEPSPQWALTGSYDPRSYTVHHWAGTWWNPAGTSGAGQREGTRIGLGFRWLMLLSLLGIGLALAWTWLGVR